MGNIKDPIFSEIGFEFDAKAAEEFSRKRMTEEFNKILENNRESTMKNFSGKSMEEKVEYLIVCVADVASALQLHQEENDLMEKIANEYMKKATEKGPNITPTDQD